MAADLYGQKGLRLAGIEKRQHDPDLPKYAGAHIRDTLSGAYLASRYAQNNHNWDRAAQYLRHALILDPDNAHLKKRTMLIMMGAGQQNRAVDLAAEIAGFDPDSYLARLFLAADKIRSAHYKGAIDQLEPVKDSNSGRLVAPLLTSWAHAGQGRQATKGLDETALHQYHKALIADMLGHKDVLANIDHSLLINDGISAKTLADTGDLFARNALFDKALPLYRAAQAHMPEDKDLAGKIAAVGEGKAPNNATGPRIRNAAAGAARAIYDMATLLFHEQSDDSARLYGMLALHMDEELDDARILLANIATRNEQPDRAISYYKDVSPKSVLYAEVRREMASLLAKRDEFDRARTLLRNLVKAEQDIRAQILVGDIFRMQSRFDSALESYNEAVRMLDNKVPAEHWNLLYARGIALERLDEWERAEEDLKMALEYEPDHPYILNYLGYSWADRGINLEQAETMIRRAVKLAPNDGYIIDSLGWVLYRQGDYAGAITHLEKAAELNPYDPVINEHLGDAYWRTGRKIEARYMWQRARNHAEDADMQSHLDTKLASGLTPLKDTPRQAQRVD